MLINGLYWFLTSIGLLSGTPLILLTCFSIFTSLLIIFPSLTKLLYQFIMKYKIFLFAISILFQLIALFSTILMIRSDAAMVFNGAMKLVDEKTISLYLSYNPNNLFLFMYERFFFDLFGVNAIWIMQFLNIIYVNLGAYLLYYFSKRFISETVANISFLFYLLLINLTPQFLTMYTDIMVLPIIGIQLILLFELFKENITKKKTILKTIILGLFTSFGFFIRPTLFILIMAFFIVYFVYNKFSKFIIVFITFTSVFFVTLSVSNYQMNKQNIVKINEQYRKTPLAFIDLGLTYIGTDQIDFQNGLSKFVNEETRVDQEYDGRYKKDVVVKDIKRRLNEYTFSTFVGHVLYKQAATMKDGSLGWNYKDAKNEGAFYINPKFENHKDNRLFNLFRNYILYTDRPTYTYYKNFLQIIYCIMIFGFIFQFIKFDLSKINQVLSIAVFGGLLFLMIFEGGKSRYMIQFLPQILVLSAMGIENIINYFSKYHICENESYKI